MSIDINPAFQTSHSPRPADTGSWDHTIATVALQIRQFLDLDLIWQTVVDSVRRRLACDRVLLYHCANDMDGQVVKESVADPQWALLGQAQDGANPPMAPNDAEFLKQFQVKASLVVPVLGDGRLWGLLIAHRCTTADPWPPDAIANLQRLAVQMGIALQQASLVSQLEEARAGLEAYVITRTESLEQANRQLAAQVEARQHIADELQKREGFLRQVLDSLFAFVGVLTPDGLLIEANQAPLDAAGITREEVLNKPFAEAYWWAYSPVAQAKIREAIVQANQGHAVRFDIDVQVRGGQFITIDFSLTPLCGPTGRITHLIPSGVDITQRKQAEAALRNSEARWQFALEGAGDGIWDWNVQTNEVFFSPQWKAMLGYDDGDVGHCVEDWSSRVHPDDLAVCHARLQRYFRGETPSYHHEHRMRCKDGRYTWILSRGQVVEWTADGQPLRMIGTHSDISTRKQAELDLKQAKEQLDLVLQASSEGFSDYNLITDEIYFSPRFKSMLGYADEELENSLEMWNSVIFEEDRKAAWALFEDYKNGLADKFSTTQRYRHKNGSTVHVLTRVIYVKNDQDQVTRIVGSYLDITSMVAMQGALKTSETQLSSVLNSSPDGIMAFRSVRDKQGQIVDFEWLLSNPKACQLVGRSADALVGKRLLEDMPRTFGEGLFEGYVHTVETGEPCQRELYCNYDDVESWFDMAAVKLEDGFAATFRNVTAIKQSERTLQRLNQELEHRVADLGQRHAEMVALSEMSDFLQAAATVEEACNTITSLIEALFPQSAGGLFVTAESHHRLDLMSQFGETLTSQPSFYPDHCWGLRRGCIHLVGVDRTSLRCQHTVSGSSLGSTLCIPLMAQGETLGLFYLSTEDPDLLTEAKQQLARTLAEQVGMAIANLKLKETLKSQSIRDPLTGLYNRRYLEESLAQEIARAQRKQCMIGVIMVDIDHFKCINDNFGHDTGDFALQQVATLLKGNLRGADIVCRYGGEEMTLILPEADLTETTAHAEDLRRAISQMALQHQGQSLGRLTASLGVATFPTHGHTMEALIKAADTALYQAKSAGRNQVFVAQPMP